MALSIFSNEPSATHTPSVAGIFFCRNVLSTLIVNVVPKGGVIVPSALCWGLPNLLTISRENSPSTILIGHSFLFEFYLWQLPLLISVPEVPILSRPH
jgi:hypothetical protein